MQYFFFAIKDCNSVLKVGDLNLNCVIALTETFCEKNRVLVISCEEEALLRVLLQLMHPNNAWGAQRSGFVYFEVIDVKKQGWTFMILILERLYRERIETGAASVVRPWNDFRGLFYLGLNSRGTKLLFVFDCLRKIAAFRLNNLSY